MPTYNFKYYLAILTAIFMILSVSAGLYANPVSETIETAPLETPDDAPTGSLEAEITDLQLHLLIEETQKMSERSFIWWLAPEYWQMIVKNIDVSSEELAVDAMMISDFFKPYIVILAASTITKSFDRIKYLSQSELVENMILIDSRGIEHRPLTDKELPPHFRETVKEFRSGFVQSFGSFGENLEFIFFRAEDNSGPIIDTKTESEFKIILNEEDFFWSLPFSALRPPMVCPTCQQILNNQYNFCPWDGTALPEELKAPPATETVEFNIDSEKF